MSSSKPQAPAVIGLVMAAGTSSRFGDADKRLARLDDGQTLIGATCAKAVGICQELWLVVAQAEDHALAEVSVPVKTLVAPNANKGLGGSLADAFGQLCQEAPREISAALVFMADMPFIAMSTLAQIGREANAQSIARPVFNGQPGHPVLIGRNFWQAMANLSDDDGGRSVIKAHQQFYRELSVSDAGVCLDIDTQSDLQALTGKRKGS